MSLKLEISIKNNEVDFPEFHIYTKSGLHGPRSFLHSKAQIVVDTVRSIIMDDTELIILNSP